MNFETPNAAIPDNKKEAADSSQMDRSLEGMAAADALIAENPLLAENPRVKFIAENNYTTEDGRELDPGTFITKMLDYLKMQEGGGISEAEVSEAAEASVTREATPAPEDGAEPRIQ